MTLTHFTKKKKLSFDCVGGTDIDKKHLCQKWQHLEFGLLVTINLKTYKIKCMKDSFLSLYR